MSCGTTELMEHRLWEHGAGGLRSCGSMELWEHGTVGLTTAVYNNLKQKRSPTFRAQLYLPAHDLFWANLRVQHHLPPLDPAWTRK